MENTVSYTHLDVYKRQVLRKITESFRDKDYQVQRTELYFLIVPGLVGLLICVLLRTIMTVSYTHLDCENAKEYRKLIGLQI